MAREIQRRNPYKERLLKLIPTEIVAAYLVIEGLIPQEATHGAVVSLISFGVLLGLIPLYLKKTMQVHQPWQIVFTMVSFVVWVYSLGGPFIHYGLHISYMGSVLLILWTLLIPLVYRPAS